MSNGSFSEDVDRLFAASDIREGGVVQRHLRGTEEEQISSERGSDASAQTSHETHVAARGHPFPSRHG